MQDPNSQDSVNNVEADAWSSFTLVVRKCLGSYEEDNYSELVERMTSSFLQHGCKMSMKAHYLHGHLFRFPENLGNQGEKQDERVHQDFRIIKERYRRHWYTHIMVDYC